MLTSTDVMFYNILAIAKTILPNFLLAKNNIVSSLSWINLASAHHWMEYYPPFRQIHSNLDYIVHQWNNSEFRPQSLHMCSLISQIWKDCRITRKNDPTINITLLSSCNMNMWSGYADPTNRIYLLFILYKLSPLVG